jgi:hypothetical protein
VLYDRFPALAVLAIVVAIAIVASWCVEPPRR